MIRNFFKIAIRNIFRHKVYSFINLLGLAIGIASCILIVLWVQYECSFEQFNTKIDRIYRVIQHVDMNGEEEVSYTIPYSLVPIIKRENPEVEDGVRVRSYGSMILNYEGKVFKENNVLLVEPSFFDIFDYKFISGNPETALNDIESLIITKSAAEKYFGNENPLGKEIKLNTRSIFTVTAVIQDSPINSRQQFDIILPFKILGEERLNSWSWESSGYLLLRPGIDPVAFSKKIADTIKRHSSNSENSVSIQNHWLANFYYPDGSMGRLQTILIFAGIALIVLVIACINFMNLSTAKATLRIKEVGIRKVVGASRKMLIGQFIGESIIMAFLSAIIAIVLVELLIPVFNFMVGRDLVFNLGNSLIIISLLLLTIIVGLVSGSYPALYLSSFNPAKVLKTGKLKSSGKGFRNALVVFQFAISIALIFSTYVIYSQMDYIKKRDLGYNKEHIIMIPYNSFIRAKEDLLKENLLKNSNILGITSSSSDPVFVGNVNPVEWDGKKTDEKILFYFLLVDPGYIDFFGLELIAGRDFSWDLESDKDAYILNESAIKAMQLEDPIGKSFTMYDDEGPIIGVLKDFHFQTLNREITPLMITGKTWWRSELYVKISPDKTDETIKFIENTFKKIIPGSPFEFSFIDERIDEYYQDIYHVADTIEYFSILAIFISCLGLFGLASFITEQRTNEIGIRKVLGSSVVGILIFFSKGYLRWLGMAALIGWPLAYFIMNKFLNMFVYKTDIDIISFLISGAITLLVAMLSVSHKTIKAANANPVNALKYE